VAKLSISVAIYKKLQSQALAIWMTRKQSLQGAFMQVSPNL